MSRSVYVCVCMCVFNLANGVFCYHVVLFRTVDDLLMPVFDRNLKTISQHSLIVVFSFDCVVCFCSPQSYRISFGCQCKEFKRATWTYPKGKSCIHRKKKHIFMRFFIVISFSLRLSRQISIGYNANVTHKFIVRQKKTGIRRDATKCKSKIFWILLDLD